MLIKHIVNQWKGFLPEVYLTSTYFLPYPCAWRHMLPHTPISQLVSHEEEDDTEPEQERWQRWKCKAGMSNWKGDNHQNMHTSCYVTDPATWTCLYLWDLPLTKQTFTKRSLWEHEFQCVGHETVTLLLWLWQLLYVTPLDDLAWTSWLYLYVKKKDIDRNFLSLCLVRFGLWPENDPQKWLHQQIGLISFSLERVSLYQILSLQMQKGLAETFWCSCLYNFAQLYFKW